MISYVLNKNIDGNKILSDIVKLVNTYSQDELVNKVLVVKVESIVEYNGDSLLPKLTLSQPI